MKDENSANNLHSEQLDNWTHIVLLVYPEAINASDCMRFYNLRDSSILEINNNDNNNNNNNNNNKFL